jgi:Holliday junction resolvase-like predicted endonuclease
MLQQVGIWQIGDDGPKRLNSATVSLEEHLESWIERDPALVESGLTIVGRQLQTEGGRLDLLALDPVGRWVIIEVKRGWVRRETTAQAIDYAACVEKMPLEELAERVDAYLAARAAGPRSLTDALKEVPSGVEMDEDSRDVRIMVVGTGRDPGLQRMVDFLSKRGNIEITVVSFGVFEAVGGQHVLVRELTESAETPAEQEKPKFSIEHVLALADAKGVGTEVRRLYDAALSVGLYAAPKKRSIMFTPPSKRSKCVLTVWVEPTGKGELNLWISETGFDLFYGIRDDEVRRELGGQGFHKLPRADVDEFAERLVRLFQDRESTEGD